MVSYTMIAVFQEIPNILSMAGPVMNKKWDVSWRERVPS